MVLNDCHDRCIGRNCGVTISACHSHFVLIVDMRIVIFLLMLTNYNGLQQIDMNVTNMNRCRAVTVSIRTNTGTDTATDTVT